MFKRFMLMMVAVVMLYAFAAFPVQAQTPEQTERHAIAALAKWVQATTNNKVSSYEAEKIVKYAYEYGKQHNVDPLIVLSIMRSESTFRHKVSAKWGSKGLMQVIPYWHRDKIRGRDIFRHSVNIDVGTQILDQCMEKSNDNVRSALFCYRGAKDKKYVAKIENTHKTLRAHLAESQFIDEQPVTVTQTFSKGRLFSTDQHLAYLATHTKV